MLKKLNIQIKLHNSHDNFTLILYVLFRYYIINNIYITYGHLLIPLLIILAFTHFLLAQIS